MLPKPCLQGMGQQPTMCIFFSLLSFPFTGQPGTGCTLAGNEFRIPEPLQRTLDNRSGGEEQDPLHCKFLSTSLENTGRCWKPSQKGWVCRYLLSNPLPTDTSQSISWETISPTTSSPKAISGDSSATSNTPCTSSGAQGWHRAPDKHSVLEPPLKIND